MLYKGDTLYLDWREDGIAELVFDAPGSVNKLDTATVASLGEALDVLENKKICKGCCYAPRKPLLLSARISPNFFLCSWFPKNSSASGCISLIASLIAWKICRFRPFPPSTAMRWAAAANACWRPIIAWRRRICALVCRKRSWASCRALAARCGCRGCLARTARWKSLPPAKTLAPNRP